MAQALQIQPDPSIAGLTEKYFLPFSKGRDKALKNGAQIQNDAKTVVMAYAKDVACLYMAIRDDLGKISPTEKPVVFRAMLTALGGIAQDVAVMRRHPDRAGIARYLEEASVNFYIEVMTAHIITMRDCCDHLFDDPLPAVKCAVKQTREAPRILRTGEFKSLKDLYYDHLARGNFPGKILDRLCAQMTRLEKDSGVRAVIVARLRYLMREQIDVPSDVQNRFACAISSVTGEKALSPASSAVLSGTTTPQALVLV